MKSEEALIGMRVKVGDGHRKPELRGAVGTIVQRYGDPGYVALDVLLEDGRSELFWHHDLEETDAPSTIETRSWSVFRGGWRSGHERLVGQR